MIWLFADRVDGQLAVVYGQVLRGALLQCRGVAECDADEVFGWAYPLGECCQFQVGVARLPVPIERFSDRGIEGNHVSQGGLVEFVALADERPHRIGLGVMIVDDGGDRLDDRGIDGDHRTVKGKADVLGAEIDIAAPPSAKDACLPLLLLAALSWLSGRRLILRERCRCYPRRGSLLQRRAPRPA